MSVNTENSVEIEVEEDLENKSLVIFHVLPPHIDTIDIGPEYF